MLLVRNELHLLEKRRVMKHLLYDYTARQFENLNYTTRPERRWFKEYPYTVGSTALEYSPLMDTNR